MYIQIDHEIICYITICTYVTLTTVSISLEVKPQLENVVVKLTSKPTLVRVFPFSINNFERDVLVRWASVKSQDSEIFVVGAGCKEIFRRGILVDKVWVEDIELVALHNLRRRIVHVVVRLIVLVPLEAGVHAVKVARLTRSVFVGP